MGVILQRLVLVVLFFTSTHQNHFFAAHESYKSLTYNMAPITNIRVSGDIGSATQQCRRTCTLDSNCNAFNIRLRSGDSTFGVFWCLFFSSSGCQMPSIAMQTITQESFLQLWDKVDGIHHRAKPCVEYCKVKYRGNCTDCRGYNNLNGLDCDTAPKLCSDYQAGAWWVLPLWPYGFYGPKITPYCYYALTLLFGGGPLQSNSNSVRSVGWGLVVVNDAQKYASSVQSIEWELISDLVAMSEKKTLTIFLILNYKTIWLHYSGFRISPIGALSLNASLDSPPSTGIPTPLSEAPFVYDPSCGAFWQFDPAIPLCNQLSIPMNFTGGRWDGKNYSNVTMGIFVE